MNDRIDVSIIIPVYNVEKYLDECMESVCNQTLKNIEIICVNDGSTDESLDILNKYAEKDPRISIISTENHGYGSAMNRGLDAAKGEYIGIVEPDDYVDLTMFEKLYNIAKLKNVEIVKSDFYRFYGTEKSRHMKYVSSAYAPCDYNKEYNPKVDKWCFRFAMNIWTGIYRNELIKDNGIRFHESPGASFQDNGFYFLTMIFAKSIYFIDEAFYYNRRDNINSSVNNHQKVYCANDEYAYIYEKVISQDKHDYLDVYHLLKLFTYKYMLCRISPEYQKEYLYRFSKEFKEACSKNELCKKTFLPEEWTEIQWIIRDPDEYYNEKIGSTTEISIVIPVYNAARFLRECLDSILCQTMQQYEVILVDDGSTDESVSIINEYVSRDNRFTLIKQEHTNAGVARNTGLKRAKGKYIIFLDADDFFSSDLLELSYTQIKRDNAEICVIASNQYDNISGEISPCNGAVRLETYPSWRPFSINDVSENPYRCFVGWPWDKLYLRSFILNNDLWFQEQRSTNDMYFIYMSLFKASKITIQPERLIYQRRNVAGSISTSRSKSYWCFIDALIAMKNELQDMGIYDKTRNHFRNYAVHSCIWNLATLDDKDAAFKLRDELLGGKLRELDILPMNEDESDNLYELNEFRQAIDSAEGLEKVREEMFKPKKQEEQTSVENSSNAKERGDFADEASYLAYCLDEIRKSKSYKVGLALTWLPRKIRGW